MWRKVIRSTHVVISMLLAVGLVACGGGDEGAVPDDGTERAGAERAGDLPEGWNVRTDRGAPADEVRVTGTDGGLRVSLGPAVILWDSTRVAEGDYTAQATFTLVSEPEHPEAYGLFTGGHDLRTDAQDYLYFLVRPGGEFLVKHRAGSETHTLVDWTPHETGGSGDAEASSRTLAIDAGDHGARFLVDGTEVASLDPAPMLVTDGIVGLRINHNLDVRVTDFTIEGS